MQKLKIAFAGTPEFALPSLESLATDAEIEIVKVFTQPDRPVGRGQKIAPPPIKVLAEKLGLPVKQTKLTAENFPQDLDCLAVVAFGQILPSEVLEMPKFGCINLHASLLPKLRGASPIQSAILAGFDETGVSFQKITEKLDAGDVFASFEIPLGAMNALELSEKLAELGGAKFPEVLQGIAAGEISAKAQDESEATHCRKIQKSDGKVDWQKDSAELLVRKSRAFSEWPGVWTLLPAARDSGQARVLKLVEFGMEHGTRNMEHITRNTEQKNGEVFKKDGKIFVKTIDGAIELKKVQLEGKKVLDVQEFTRGESEFVGVTLG